MYFNHFPFQDIKKVMGLSSPPRAPLVDHKSPERISRFSIPANRHAQNLMQARASVTKQQEHEPIALCRRMARHEEECLPHARSHFSGLQDDLWLPLLPSPLSEVRNGVPSALFPRFRSGACMIRCASGGDRPGSLS